MYVRSSKWVSIRSEDRGLACTRSIWSVSWFTIRGATGSFEGERLVAKRRVVVEDIFWYGIYCYYYYEIYCFFFFWILRRLMSDRGV